MKMANAILVAAIIVASASLIAAPALAAMPFGSSGLTGSGMNGYGSPGPYLSGYGYPGAGYNGYGYQMAGPDNLRHIGTKHHDMGPGNKRHPDASLYRHGYSGSGLGYGMPDYYGSDNYAPGYYA